MSNLAPRRIELANTIDEYDRLISEHNESKAETFTVYRAKLEEEGFTKSAIRAELKALKAAIRKRQKVAKAPDEVEEHDALTDAIFSELTSAESGVSARTRDARGQQ